MCACLYFTWQCILRGEESPGVVWKQFEHLCWHLQSISLALLCLHKGLRSVRVNCSEQAFVRELDNRDEYGMSRPVPGLVFLVCSLLGHC